MSYDERHTSGESIPAWYTTHAPEDTRCGIPLPTVDVLVIGAGMAGLSVAYHLLRAGRSVLVVDKAAVGSGETGRTTAHLANALDDRFTFLERIHGVDGARLAAESHRAAIEDIFAIATSEQIECGLERVDGFLFTYEDEDPRQLEAELKAARRAGLTVDMLDRAPLPFRTGRALRFADQAEFDPMAYLHGLARAIRGLGGTICTGMRVDRLDEGSPCVAHLHENGTVTANAVVVATNTPINDVFAMHTKQAPYRSYVVGMSLPKHSVERALYWDMRDPYHYIRLAGDDLLIVGGEDHKVGQTSSPDESWARLVKYTRKHFPMAGEVRFRWSGQILEPADGLAFIGKNPGRSGNVFVVTGDSGNGITHGALAGMLISDLVTGRENPWTRLYDPARKMWHPLALKEFVRENVNVARQYMDWAMPEESARIEPGAGAVVRRGVHRVAVYLDDEGMRHECSARCPHLGGLVHWNAAEHSWDCPCHGSRFDPYGHVLTGPAASDLTPMAAEERKPETALGEAGERASREPEAPRAQRPAK